MLWGPPGCGKTFLAKALAGQFGAGFISIAMSDVLDMWLGNSEQNLHTVFNQARQYADVSGTPCVVFIDELDGLGSRRSRVAHSGIRSVVTQLLTELDGTASDNDGVVVVGATNTPWDVEPALRRPGRFDRTICVLPPDLEARTAILGAAFRSRPVAPGLDLASVARRTDGHSGADSPTSPRRRCGTRCVSPAPPGRWCRSNRPTSTRRSTRYGRRPTSGSAAPPPRPGTRRTRRCSNLWSGT